MFFFLTGGVVWAGSEVHFRFHTIPSFLPRVWNVILVVPCLRPVAFSLYLALCCPMAWMLLCCCVALLLCCAVVVLLCCCVVVLCCAVAVLLILPHASNLNQRYCLIADPDMSDAEAVRFKQEKIIPIRLRVFNMLKIWIDKVCPPPFLRSVQVVLDFVGGAPAFGAPSFGPSTITDECLVINAGRPLVLLNSSPNHPPPPTPAF